MLFLSKWRMHPGKAQEAYKVFSQLPAGDEVGDGGGKIRLIGRWHDVSGGTGVAISECDDPQALALWSLNWTMMMDIEITPVVADEEAKAIGKAMGS